MSKNIDQIFIANPSSSAPSSALLYLGLSPFAAGDDSAILVGDFLEQIPSATWVDVASGTQAMTPNVGYVTDNGASLVTYTLPAAAAVGTTLEVVGKSAGGWSIAQNSMQEIFFGAVHTTSGTGGSLSSSLQYDCVRLVCVTANLSWVVTNATGNLAYV
jgi:hypothetical protein